MVDLADGEVSLVVRSKEGLFHTAPLEKNLVVGSKRQFLSECADSDISSCGTLIMGFTPKGELSIFKFDGTKILDASFTDLTNCYFSKGNKFVVATHGSGKATKVTIFRISNKEVVSRANQSHTIDIGFMKSGKRYVVFLANDTIVGVQIAPHIMQVFDITSNFEPKGKLEIVPSTDLGGLYFGSAPLLYANNPNTTKDNQKGTLFEIYNLQTMTVHHSSFFAGIQQIDIHPSPNANVILIRGHKYVDTSGQSYYGKNTLDLLDVDGHKKKKITTYNGPIYNLAWNPKGDSFAVCGGFLPSHTVIFDLKGEPIMVAAKDHKNSIFWSPNGEFLAICGFGNLNGEIMIWNLAKKSLLGKCQHGDAGDLEWAPDGRHFVTKVEFKFLREGNTYRVYDYHGTLLNKVEFPGSQLFSVKWFPIGKLSVRPLSPAPVKATKTMNLKTGEEDFMAACREKTSGPFLVKLEDIVKANAGQTREVKDEKPTEAKKHVLGLPSEEKKKKKKKAKN